VTGININEAETRSTAFTSCSDGTKKALCLFRFPFLSAVPFPIRPLQCRTSSKKNKICLESLQHKDILNRQKLEALTYLGEISGLSKKNPKPKQPQNSQQAKHGEK